jgi:hypothetical protein
MSLRMLESFDWSNLTDDYRDKYQSLSGGASIQPGRTGPWSLYDGALRVIFTAKGTWTVGCAVRVNLPLGVPIVLFLCDGLTPQFRLDMDVGVGVMRVYRGGDMFGVGGVLLGTTVTPLPLMPNQWYHLQVKVVVSALAGSVEVFINGLSSLVLVGINTQATVNAWADQLNIGSGWCGIDDLWVNDGDGAAPYNGFMGDLKIINIKPIAAGDLTDWTPSAGANWQCVDDIPPDGDVTTVASAVVGQIDTYNFENPALTGLIRGVQSNVLARKDDAGVRTIRPIYRQGGVNYLGSNDTLNVTYKTTKEVMQVDPATTLDWTAANINSAQFGQEITA